MATHRDVDFEPWRTRLRALRTHFLVAVSLLTLAAIVGVLIYYSAFPDAGIEYSSPVTLVGRVDPDGPAAKAGIRSGDQVIAINGRPFTVSDDPYVLPNDRQATLTILRDGQLNQVIVYFGSSFASGEWRMLTFYAVSFGFWLTATLILYFRTRDERATLLILCCQLMALVMAVLPVSNLGIAWGNRLMPILMMLLVAIFVHYHSVFPEQKRLGGHRTQIVCLIYAIGVSLILARTLISLQLLPDWVVAINIVMRAFILACMLLGPALLAHTLLTTHSPLVRRQANLMMLGTGLAVISGAGLIVLPQLMGGSYLLPTYDVYAFLLLIPISYAYTTYRHRLLEIEPKINRAAVYATLAFIVIGAYLAIWELMNRLFQSFLPASDPKLAGLITVLPIALSISPLKTQVQKWIDKAFYGGWYDYRSLIAAGAHKLNRAADMGMLVEQLVTDLATDMRVQAIALILRSDEGGDFAVRKAIGFDARFQREARINPESALATYFGRHPEPLSHSQLEGALGGQAALELWPWTGAQLWVPVVKDRELEGIIVLGLKEIEDFFDLEDRLILSTLAQQAAVVIQNVTLLDAVRRQMNETNRLYLEVQRAREEEKMRIARDLHDVTIQDLIGITYRLERSELPTWVVAGVRDDLQQAILGLREVCATLHPPILEELGLPAALQECVSQFQKKQQVRTDLNTAILGDVGQLPDEVKLGLFRVLQEALANVGKHSAASSVRVDFIVSGHDMMLSVDDDGLGFVVPERLGQLTTSNHFGLAGMQQRVEAMGGTLTIDSQPGQGTRLVVKVPTESSERRSKPQVMVASGNRDDVAATAVGWE